MSRVQVVMPGWLRALHAYVRNGNEYGLQFALSSHAVSPEAHPESRVVANYARDWWNYPPTSGLEMPTAVVSVVEEYQIYWDQVGYFLSSILNDVNLGKKQL